MKACEVLAVICLIIVIALVFRLRAVGRHPKQLPAIYEATGPVESDPQWICPGKGPDSKMQNKYRENKTAELVYQSKTPSSDVQNFDRLPGINIDENYCCRPQFSNN